MALARARRFRTVDYWPGFVDALSTMLLMFTFLISVFMMAQFFLSRDVTGKDVALQRLNRQIDELTSLLALERSAKTDAQSTLASLTATLEQTRKDKADLQNLLDQSNAGLSGAGSQAAQANRALEAEKQVSARALAQKVQELARYRSDFFGRLRQILGNRPGIRVVGDRFVFQSEVLFDSGKAEINPAGRAELDTLANALGDLEREIPTEIQWVLRVDGHTDKRPIQSPQFHSNWELSAARAIAVVQYLISKGVSPQHLVAAGFGEFQPLDVGENDEAYRRNRRIELKLTER